MVCLVEGEGEVELLSAAGEELKVVEVLSPTFGKAEDVVVFVVADAKAGVVGMLCPLDVDTVVKVVSKG